MSTKAPAPQPPRCGPRCMSMYVCIVRDRPLRLTLLYALLILPYKPYVKPAKHIHTSYIMYT